MKFALVLSITFLIFTHAKILAGVFMAVSTDKAHTLSRAKLYYGDNVKVIGKTKSVFELERGDKNIRFNRFEVINIAEGFIHTKHRSATSVSSLNKNKIKLREFAKKFPKSKKSISQEISLIEEAIDNLSKNYVFDKDLNTWNPQKTINQIGKEITINNEALKVSSVVISDPKKGLVSIIHDKGIIKEHFTNLSEQVLEMIGPKNLKTDQFIEVAKSINLLNENKILGKPVTIKSIEMNNPFSTKLTFFLSEGVEVIFAESLSSNSLKLLKSSLGESFGKLMTNVSILKEMSDDELVDYRERQLLIEEIVNLLIQE